VRTEALLLAGALAALAPVARAQDHSGHVTEPPGATGVRPAHSHDGGTNSGDSSDPAIAALIERVRATTVHLRDRKAAARAGYRRVGIDFPAMGEHWVNPGLLLRRGLDFDKPSILTYTVIDDRPTLTGVVFTIALDPGESAPAVAGAERPWHEHNESIADESLVRPAVSAPRNDRRRLAVLHLWTEAPNPAGPFATENWALPFARLGLTVPDPLPPGAARALSLAAGGDSYFIELINAASGPDASAAARPIVDQTRAEVLSLVSNATRSKPLSAHALATLGSMWTRMAERIADACGDCAGALAER
jgi:hypothetical protein